MKASEKVFPLTKAVTFQLTDEAQRKVFDTLKRQNIEVWEEKNLTDLRSVLKSKRPDFLFIGSKYLLKKGSGLITSLKRSVFGLSVVIVLSIDERRRILPFLNEDVSGILYDPYYQKEIMFVLNTADKITKSEIQYDTTDQLLSHLLDLNKIYIGKSPNTNQVRKSAFGAKKNRQPILIIGETGCGKTHISNFIHINSEGTLSPFRVYNPITEPERGRGLTKYIEGLPQSGTLVIRNTQNLKAVELSKLNKMLKDSFDKKGNSPRIILHHDPSFGIQLKFEDISFQNIIQISPLRERKEDIIPIAGYYMNSFSKIFNVQKLNISPSARKLLINHTWPKNVLDLISVIIFVLVSAEGESVYPYNLPDFISSEDPFAMEKVSLERLLFSKLMPIIKKMNMDKMEGLHPIVISRVEAPLIKMVLEEMGGNQSKTAKILGINRNTLSKKIKEYNIVV